jgi:hypothetical protein
MSSSAESKETEVNQGSCDVIGGSSDFKPGQKYPTPSPGNGGGVL